MRLSAIVPLVALLVAAGCLDPDPAGPAVDAPSVLHMTFTLHNTSPGNGGGEANPGPHCATAWVQDDKATVERDELVRVGPARPFLIVEPGLRGGWATLGTGGYPAKLPFDVPTGVPDEARPVGSIAWQPLENGTGRVLVNGAAVELPYSWTTHASDGSWRAEARIGPGPDRIDTFRMQECM